MAEEFHRHAHLLPDPLRRMSPSPTDLLVNPAHDGHVAQLYRDEDDLVRGVGLFLGTGLWKGEGALVAAVPEHRDAFLRRLVADGHDVREAIAAGRLTIAEARPLME